MSGLAPGAGWTLVIAGLALLALLLFLLAVRFGRWGVWLAGYLCVVLALLLAIMAAQRRAPVEPGDPARDGHAGISQPSAGSGVLDPVDRTGHAWHGAWAIDEVL